MRKHSIPNFIKKTWEMLEFEPNWSIISWSQEGTAFQIINEALFADILLPHYFKHSNVASFIRQLNMYNFHKQKTEHGETLFFHKLFRRNHRQLLIGIKRKPSEAEINEADQLIKQLAPECLEENSTDALKPASPQEQKLQNQYNNEMQVPQFADPTPIWIFTPYLMPNMYQDYQWQPERMLTNNIIIQSLQGQNEEKFNYQVTY